MESTANVLTKVIRNYNHGRSNPVYKSVEEWKERQTSMKKKSLIVLSSTLLMSLSLPLLSYAQPYGIHDAGISAEETCPLLINGQRVVALETGGGAPGHYKIHYGVVIMVGTDRLEEGDLVVDRGTIVSSQLNVDHGKLTELDMSKITYAENLINGKDSIEILCISNL